MTQGKSLNPNILHTAETGYLKQCEEWFSEGYAGSRMGIGFAFHMLAVDTVGTVSEYLLFLLTLWAVGSLVF